MKYTVTGADRKTGEELELLLEAGSAEEASAKANRKGILVSECREANPQVNAQRNMVSADKPVYNAKSDGSAKRPLARRPLIVAAGAVIAISVGAIWYATRPSPEEELRQKAQLIAAGQWPDAERNRLAKARQQVVDVQNEVTSNPALLCDATVPVTQLRFNGVALGDPQSAIQRFGQPTANALQGPNGVWYYLENGQITCIAVGDATIKALGIDASDEITERFGTAELIHEQIDGEDYVFKSRQIIVHWATGKGISSIGLFLPSNRVWQNDSKRTVAEKVAADPILKSFDDENDHQLSDMRSADDAKLIEHMIEIDAATGRSSSDDLNHVRRFVQDNAPR